VNMPAKYRVKSYQEDGVYYIYNRGIDGREVFGSDQDYNEFLSLCQRYVDEYHPEPVIPGFKSERPYLARRKQAMNLHGEVEVWAYCLMPNNFYLLVSQKTKTGMTKFMRRVLTGYVMYFNKKHKRRGGLWEGIYKALRVENMDQALSVSRYIHLRSMARTIRRFGPVEAITSSRVEDYPHSSYKIYLNGGRDTWVNCLPILKELGEGERKWRSYGEYVQDARVESKWSELL